jgi:Na+-translocating ferredoxin:NAD+ oxidoreductase RnfC subunit
VVNNVETLVNVAAAAAGKPVTHKTLTLAGAVHRPVTLTVPVGTSCRACLDAAGGLATDDPVLCLGGLMMGQTTDDLDAPITKTATGVVILPRRHPVIQRKLQPATTQARIGKSACDQCRYCTEYCPRFLLGYAVEPHHYDDPAPFVENVVSPGLVVLLLKQSAGVACQPLVRTGDRVRAGQVVGDPPAGALGASLHAPFAATVTAIGNDRISLTRTP